MKPIDDLSYKRILINLYDGVYTVDSRRRITFWNKAAERITGFTPQEVVGRSCADNILTHIDANGTTLCLGHCPLAATLEDGTPRTAEVFLHNKLGHRVPVSIRVNPLRNAAGRIVGGLEIFTDLSDQNTARQRRWELEKLSLLDETTQLANRVYIERELAIRLQEQTKLNIPFGILRLDIDHFEEFANSYGPEAGGRVLKAVASTLTANSRPFDLFGRWRDSAFIGVIHNVAVESLEMLGNRLRILVANAYLVDDNGSLLRMTVSVGATMGRPGEPVTELIARAESLVRQSREAGNNRLTLG